jgi:cytidine kinase
MRDAVQVVVVGSIGLDTIETPEAKVADVLGGSCSYACAAASFFAPTGMVGVVGREDFGAEHRALYDRFGIDTAGLQVRAGRTFRWSGVYEQDMVNRRTLLTELNVFEHFSPDLPAAYRRASFLLLGNIAPELQLHVLDQAEGARFVAADTMNLWINTEREALMRLIGRVNLLTVNDEEARMLTDCHNLRRCAETIRAWGPDHVVIKKGEHGAMLFSGDGIFLAPAYPVERLYDPTGAGDCFAGACIGALAAQGAVDGGTLRHALLAGATVASFGVESFSLERLASLSRAEIDTRLERLRDMLRV